MSAPPSEQAIQVGEWLVEPDTDTISHGQTSVKLEPRTMRLLVCLIESRGSVVSIDRLLTEVWTGVIVGPASVYQAVSLLRKVLGDTDPEPTYIATVPRKGYRLIAPVQQVPPPTRSATAASSVSLPSAAPQRKRRFLIASSASALAVLGLLGWFALRSYFTPPAPSIVVLPFVDLTADKSDQPFCDGLTEELSNWLAQIPALRVVARTSAFAFRGRDEDVRKIGRTLDTNHVLEGSMRRFGNHMRVTVQLIDARSGFHLWSAVYDREMADTIKMQEDISRAVAENLEIRLTPIATQRLQARQSDNPQAYESYLLARHYQQLSTAESNREAIRLYRLSLSEDPKFALAYVGLAYALLNENWLAARPINEIAAEAEPLLEMAAKLDASLPDIYAVRGALRAEQFQIEPALKDFDQAIALNPNDSAAFKERGRLFLIAKGQPREALADYTQAADLDPLDSQPQAQRCLALQALGQFGEAATACARARALQPQNYWPLTVTSWLAAAQGRLDEALEWNEKALAVAPDVFDLYMERARWFLTLGLPARARETLEQARVHTHQEEAVNDELSRVAYYEGGATALRAHLASTRLEESTHAAHLFSAAYFRLLIGDIAEAQAAIERAYKSADFSAADLENPWQVARWGNSDGLTVALVAMRTGDQATATRHLDALTATLDQLVRNGEQRFAVDEMRATVLALRGDGDNAMRALTRAAQLGWRRSWWAEREPDVAALWSRTDFRELVARVNTSNADLRKRLVEPSR
jgi:TolB-like protein/DNA-binding winged helix-turn-helix (wHTH) protein/Tfp pilus assembly protein PilF